jgi:phage baseplate assembly protein W
MSRADKRTRTGVIEEIYSDFMINFDKNPVTGNLARVVNDDAVRQSLRQIVLTQMEEWPFHATLGSKIYRQLFEPIDSVTAIEIREAIEQACRHEPRAQVVSVSVVPETQENGYRVTIYFYTTNTTQVQSVTEFLKRVR